VALTGVYLNRSGEPDSRLTLSQRELTLPWGWGMAKENSGMALRLNWRIIDAGAGAGEYFDGGFGFSGGWLHAKTALVVVLAAYHLWCGRLLAEFAGGRSTRTHVWFRFFNEVPVLVLVAICILAVVKPF